MAPNKYTGHFNKIVKDIQDARSAGASTSGNLTQSTLDALMNNESFNRPINNTEADAEDFKNRVHDKIESQIGPNVGSKVLDILSRPLYAVGSTVEQGLADQRAAIFDKYAPEHATQEQKDRINRGALDTLGVAGKAAWAGLSGENKITPGHALINETGQTGVGGFVTALGVDLLTDPLNLVGGGVLRNGAAATKAAVTGKGIEGIKAGLKSTETAKAVKDAATVAVRQERAVPGSVIRELNEAKTPAAVAKAVQSAKGHVNTDDITKRFAELEKANVVSPTVPIVAADEAPSILSGIKAAARHTVSDGAHANASQAAQFINLRNQTMKTIKEAGPQGSNSAYKRTTMLRDTVMGKLKIAEQVAESQGIPHVMTSGDAGARKWPLKTTDVIESLPDTIATRHVFSGFQGGQVHMSAIERGAAKALDIAGQGLKKTESVIAIRNAMKAGGISGRTDSLTSLANNLYNATPDLLARVGTNRAVLGLKHEEDVRLLTAGEIRRIQDNIASSPMDMSQAITSATSNVAKAADDLGVGTASVITAQTKVAEAIGNMVDKADFSNMQFMQNIVRARKAGVPAKELHEKIVSGMNIQARIAIDEAKKLGMITNKADEYAIGMMAQQSKVTRLHVRNNQETRGMLEIYRNQGVTGYAGYEIGNFNKGLETIRKLASTEELQGAISTFRHSGSSGIPELDQQLFQLFDPKDGLAGVLWRNGADDVQINHALKDAFRGAKGSVPKFDKIAAQNDIVKLADQWKDWKIDDPIDFLSRTYDAARKLAANQTIAVSIESHFGSEVFRNGWKRIVSDSESRIAGHINPKTWFPPEVAQGIDFLEWAAGKPRSFAKEAKQGNRLGIVVDKFYDPLLSAIKQYQTIVRPGHHIRNFFSDALFSHAAGMNNVPKYYTQALGVLTGKSPNFAQRVTVGGRTYDITGDAMLRDFKENGLLPNYHTTEDILTSNVNQKGKLDKLVNDNALVRLGGKTSENLSAEGKLAQYMWELSRPENIKHAVDLPHLKAIAARNVRKYHPDASGLGSIEAKYMRRLIPYYSWIRQAIPLVMEATVTRPGRIIAVPKANYDLAVANGVDPESVSQQFPTDSIYPSYFTENLLGPVGTGGTGFNLGSPAESVYGDIFNTIGNDPRMTLGMVSPILKAPVEMATRTRLDSGREIYDTGEYVDSNIPLWSNLASISGYSSTNTLTGVFDGKPGPVLDPQRSVELGNKEHWFNNAMVNFFTGIGITDYGNLSDKKNALRSMKGGEG